MGSRMESWPLARGSRWQEELVGVWSEGQEMPVETHKPRMEEDDKEIIPHIPKRAGKGLPSPWTETNWEEARGVGAEAGRC